MNQRTPPFWKTLRSLAALFLWALSAAAPTAQAATYAYRAATFAYDTPSASATSVTWNTTMPSPACTGYPNGGNSSMGPFCRDTTTQGELP